MRVLCLFGIHKRWYWLRDEGASGLLWVCQRKGCNWQQQDQP